MLCEICSNIHFKPLENCGLPSEAVEEHRHRHKSSSLFYFHHEDENALEASSKGGCKLCIMLWHVVSNPGLNRRLFGRSVSLRNRVFLFIDEYPERVENERSYVNIDVECDDLRTEGRLGLMPPDKWRGLDPKFPIIFDDDMAPTASSDSDMTTMSPSNIALARIWLENCKECHHPCIEGDISTSVAFPRRVIDLTNLESPQLIDYNGLVGHYVALSYKWGSDRTCITKAENIKERMMKPLLLGDLPKTFQDAITMTHHLGYQYLWIDALCIIQDSETDSDLEIKSMDIVYRNAVLTIFSAGASDGGRGLSSTRNPLKTKPCQVPVKFTKGELTLELTTIISFYTPRYSYSRDFAPAGPYPLYDRGWVLQEQLMSRRCLIFGSRFISWECLCTRSSEKWPTITPKRDKLIVDVWRSTLDTFPEMRKRLAHWHDGSLDTFNKWYELMENYSRRDLSRPEDVLRALEGLSNALVKLYKFTYAFGLWIEDLPPGLGWFVRKSRSNREEPVVRTERIGKAATIPSWSWASCWGHEIEFRSPKNSRYQRYFEFVGIDADCDGASNSSTSRSMLLVNGHIKPARVRPQPSWTEEDLTSLSRKAGLYDKPLESPLWVGSVHDIVTEEVVGRIAYDQDPEILKFSEIKCLLCSTGTWHDDVFFTALALIPTSRSDTKYQRIGLIFLDCPTWFDVKDSAHRPESYNYTIPADYVVTFPKDKIYLV
ncbi:HET-domain-containing protein [Pyrenochaeta sp. DS3sAY3a]|nr:HET-domain-containing protein [Pyrenochaeta sp. DS3sAY3a]